MTSAGHWDRLPLGSCRDNLVQNLDFWHVYQKTSGSWEALISDILPRDSEKWVDALFIHTYREESCNIERKGLLPTELSLRVKRMDMHTYIIDNYNAPVSIIDLVSHTSYVVCVNFLHKWRDLQFKIDSGRQIFWETFHGDFIYSQSFCWEGIAEEILFEFYFDVWPWLRTLALRLISQHTTP